MRLRRQFGELELAIIQILRTRERCSVQEVVDSLPGKPKYTTVMTVMGRLSIKGELRRERRGRRYYYWIDKELKRTGGGLIKRLLKRTFGGQPSILVQYLIDEGTVSSEELDAIARLIKRVQGHDP